MRRRMDLLIQVKCGTAKPKKAFNRGLSMASIGSEASETMPARMLKGVNSDPDIAARILRGISPNRAYAEKMEAESVPEAPKSPKSLHIQLQQVTPSSPCKAAAEAAHMANNLSKDGQESIAEFMNGISAPIQERVKKPTKKGSPTSGSAVLGLVDALLALVHELQWERGLSCLTCAAASIDDGADDLKVVQEKLFQQYVVTNSVLKRTLQRLNMMWKPEEDELRHLLHDGVARFQQVSIQVLLQRPVVSAAVADPLKEWIERYSAVTSGETGYHRLIAHLLEWMIRAVNDITFDDHDSMELTREFQLLTVFKEQLGRERSFLASKSHSRWELGTEACGTFTKILSGRMVLHQLLGVYDIDGKEKLGEKDESKWTMPPVMRHFQAMEAALNSEANDPNYHLKAEEVTRWFNELTHSMNSFQEGLIELLQILNVSPNIDDACVPTGSMVLTDADKVFTNDTAELDDIVKELAYRLKSGEFKRVMVMVGAGISVSANLPDFRSSGGLYDQLRKEGYNYPEVVFTKDFMEKDPSNFYAVMSRLRTEGITPTITHFFIKLLHDKGFLHRCYTQNIDALERSAGVPPSALVEAHGSMMEAKCSKCDADMPTSELWKPLEAGDYPRCKCTGLLRPNIVFFGEPLPAKFKQNAWHDIDTADLLIVMGTSLSVQPFAGLVHKVRQSCPRLVVNLHVPNTLKRRPWQKVASFMAPTRNERKDGFLLSKCDAGIMRLCEEMGWTSDLNNLIGSHRGTIDVTEI